MIEHARPAAAPPDFGAARAVADTVLYEGYVLYPYRASAPKNQLRWQFGVLVPPGYREGEEPAFSQTECILERPAHDAEIHIRLRFLQLQARTVEEAIGATGETFRPVASLGTGDAEVVPWDEGVEQEIDVVVAVSDLLGDAVLVEFAVAGGREADTAIDGDRVVGRVVRERWPLDGALRVSTRPLDGRPAVALRVVVENRTPWDAPGGARDVAIRRSLIGAHLFLGATGGEFISPLDPPPWAETAVAGCRNLHTFPVLVGPTGSRRTMLSSPIVLYDHPQVAPESKGDFFDATEIDELLTLRTLTLTPEEKRAARATDPRAAALVDRVEATTARDLSDLHGTVRGKRTVPERPDGERNVRLRPDGRSLASLTRGSRVRLRPKPGGDVQDMFLDGRVAVVEKSMVDADGTAFVAVTVEDDPAADLHREYGRFLFFALDELEALEC